MKKWVKKGKVAIGSAALMLALFGASMVPGVAYVPSAEAATDYTSIMSQADSTSDIDAKRGKRKGKDRVDRDDDDDNDEVLNPRGRRSRWDS